MKIKFNKKGNIIFLAKYTVKGGRITFTFPKGFKSDGASIPLILQAWFKPYEGDTLDAALVHDALYSAKGRFLYGKEEFRVRRAQADRLFRQIMARYDVPKWKRNSFWVAVRLFGWYPWLRNTMSTKRLVVSFTRK